MNYSRRHLRGFTLIEMLLIVVVLIAIMVMMISYNTQKSDQFKRDKATQQMQQILNAALLYYINNGQWPITTCNGTQVAINTTLLASYVSVVNNPWGSPLMVWCDVNNNFFIQTTLPATTYGNRDAAIIAHVLPMGVAQTNTATAQIVPPGQNLNNARSFNFGSVYHSGACVPVPTCPAGMTPDIQVSVAAANGVDYPPDNCSGAMDDPTQCTFVMHSISSSNAYAVGGPTYSVGAMPACGGGAPSPCAMGGYPLEVLINSSPTGYWRVCLQVAVQNQPIVVQNTTNPAVLPRPTGNCNTQDCSRAWGEELGTVMAITRCVPQNEVSGSDLTVWSP